jgi:hypothetical protein
METADLPLTADAWTVKYESSTLSGLPAERPIGGAHGHTLQAHPLGVDAIGLFPPGILHDHLVLSALQARSILAGDRAWLLSIWCERVLVGCVIATLVEGRLRSQLSVSAVGRVPAANDYWSLMEKFGARCGATSIQFESVTKSAESQIPDLKREASRYAGERLYVVDLPAGDLAARFSKNTKRNIARATKAGAALRITRDAVALRAHLQLTGASVERREIRGEDVAERASSERVARLLKAGAGALYQVVVEGEALSSNFVFRLGASAYYYDGGSSPSGMELGTSHFLMAALLAQLREDGVRALNLGIARAGNEGLARFKEGFGARLAYVERVLVARDAPLRLLRNLVRHFGDQRSA